MVSSLNSRLEKEYYSNTIKENIGNIRQNWKIVNEIVNLTSKNTKIDSIIVYDRVITDMKVIPNIISTSFSNVGENLEDKIPYELNPLTSGIYSINNNLTSFTFLEIAAEDVANVYSTIKTSHGSGVNGISALLLKLQYIFLQGHYYTSLTARFSMGFSLIAGKLQGLRLLSTKALLMNKQIVGQYQYYQSFHAFSTN